MKKKIINLYGKLLKCEKGRGDREFKIHELRIQHRKSDLKYLSSENKIADNAKSRNNKDFCSIHKWRIHLKNCWVIGNCSREK